MVQENVEYVAVDFGYGFVKAISSEGKRVIFSSLIGEGHERNLVGSVFGKESDNEENIRVKVDDKIYFVGKLAEKEAANVTRNFSKEERYTDDSTKILINIAIQLVSSSQNVYLLTGLPLDFYQKQSKLLTKTLTGPQKSIKWVSGSLKGKTIRNNIIRTLVFPQGASAIMAALINRQGKARYPELMNDGIVLALIDIGYRTTDYIVVEVQKNGSFMPRIALSGTFDKGVTDLRNAIKQHYKEKTGGIDLAESNVEKALNIKKVKNGKDYIHFDVVIEEAKKSIAKNIADHLNQIWKNESKAFDEIFIAGGGSKEFKDFLNPYFDDRLKSIENSQFANAIGYLRLGKAILRKKEVI